MDQESQRRELIEAVDKARGRYLKLTDRYSGFLKQAHESEHRSQAKVDALQNASAIGPELTVALKEHRDAVELLLAFIKQS